MKRKINLFIILILALGRIGESQDLKNFYEDFNNIFISDYKFNNGNSTYPFQKPIQYGPGFSGPYDGEYEIDIENLFWWYNRLNFNYPAISYQMEIVSFPFTKDCAFNLGCAYTPGDPNYSDDRTLTMPGPNTIFSSSNISYMWSYPSDPYAILYGKTPEAQFYGKFSSQDNSPFIGNSHGLVTASFHALNATPYFNSDHQILPHTIIKHSISLHCNSSITSPIELTLTFLYDNTRGQMRFYPFYPDNYSSSPGSGLHDLIFIPEILVNDNYTDFSNPPVDILLSGNGSLDYFPFIGIPQLSCYTIPQNQNDLSFYPNPGLLPDLQYVFPPPQALLTSPLRSYQGAFTAGYKQNPLISSKIISMVTNPSLKHNYTIDQNIDLKLINSSDKTIYNPSEVIIKANADNLHFPSHYSFKTIRGTYPSLAEAILANTTENGGPYADPRDVPVPTDLSPVANEPWLASTYTLEAGSKLTFDPCLTIYDASFNVLPQSTLVIENDDLLFGKHRHRIFNLGGLVLAKNQDFFLQNENIVSPQRYQFEGKNTIEAGYDVTTAKPNGDYNVETGAAVNILAENEVHLAPGFHASEGSDFHAGIAPVTLLPCPPLRLSDTNGHQNQNSDSGQKIKVVCMAFPNPSAGKIKVYLSNFSKIESLIVANSLGQIIYENMVNQLLIQIDLTDKPDGLYFIHAKSGDSVYTTKIIKN